MTADLKCEQQKRFRISGPHVLSPARSEDAHLRPLIPDEFEQARLDDVPKFRDLHRELPGKPALLRASLGSRRTDRESCSTVPPQLVQPGGG